jgi:hypothetical protein
MKTVKKVLQYLLSEGYFHSALDIIYGLALTAGVFFVIGYLYIFYPAIIVYFMIACFLVAGWFMMYFLVPEWYDRIQKLKYFIVQLFNKYFRS